MISVALYEPQIPQNTGNIARLAVGLDIELYLVGKLGFSIDDKYLKRAGLDYWENLKLKVYDNYGDFASDTGERRKIFATTKGATPYFKFNYRVGDIVIFGSETKGLPSNLLIDNVGQTVTIPMPGSVRSLNLSNSASIIAYHSLIELGYFSDFTVNRNYGEFFHKTLA
ncbi:MAG TPA: tRNA (cytidine(34)-2'-O)-methyltransferase [Spirochaetota bacterium]|nr:tRNA (cytidine(34)-2'-O)-methyltransferase [Spirochaetota bacterium]HOS31609.1 tRNA (cytidine(34)-2'-O)-methyltransferase [Spirochaetota bacterium]HOS54796.1 tRNA (cytidine(34)-2'-O)-methyltransferase [Spirochaetota bacterium]HPK61410.1 tRNA (cytidine(34)-2'-O)-methyltransferase [Spirochaetota bacterium]HQF77402.1 tRNA (cytidine(34)-2'-O)-methyltransferase [Spirochaetota bacterium]